MQTAETIQPRRTARRLLKRHNHFLLLDPRFCKDLSFWFKHNRNCYQMCTSGPWMHWQALIAMTTPPGPPPHACPGQRGSGKLSPGSLPSAAVAAPGFRSSRAVPGHGPCRSGQWPTDWISDLPWTCLVPVNLSGPLSSAQCCGMGPLPHRPCCQLPVPPCSSAAKRKFSTFPF